MDRKRGEMFRRSIILGVLFTIMILFSINVVSSKKLISDNNVIYDSESLDIFNSKILAEQNMWHNETNYQTLKIIDNEVWLRVLVDLKDNSGIEIVGNKTEKLELSKQEDKWFKPKIDEILNTLSEEDIKGTRRHLRGFGGYVSEEGFEKLKNNKDVRKIIWPKHGAVALLDESAPLINADDAWNTLGYTGEDVKVCIIDSGVDKTHPDLSGKIVAEQCYCRSGGGCCPNGNSTDNNATDEDGHGTHVAGIIASQDSTYKGVAYDVGVYVVKTLDEDNNGNIFDVGLAIGWCRSQGVDVISMSLIN